METKMNFKEILEKSYNDIQFADLSPLFKNREQLKLKMYKMAELEIFSLEAVDYIEYKKDGEEKEFGVMVFSEYPDKFYFTGKKVSAWIRNLSNYFPTYEDASKVIKENKLKIKFFITETNNGDMLDFELMA